MVKIINNKMTTCGLNPLNGSSCIQVTANETTVKGNTIDTAGVAINVTLGSEENLIKGNSIVDNDELAEFALIDENEDCGTNTWEKNKLTKAKKDKSEKMGGGKKGSRRGRMLKGKRGGLGNQDCID
mmetsp:Transcript_14856/g.21798  ORF Transcript_14856/g.21798 Transcript_14856/m.21798 type:complete len:127 (-) Transcript_14856:213-593(-)